MVIIVFCKLFIEFIFLGRRIGFLFFCCLICFFCIVGDNFCSFLFLDCDMYFFERDKIILEIFFGKFIVVLSNLYNLFLIKMI